MCVCRREDVGLLVYKDHLPVSQVVVGDTSRSGSEAKVTVGPLRCWGDRECFSLPHTHTYTHTHTHTLNTQTCIDHLSEIFHVITSMWGLIHVPLLFLKGTTGTRRPSAAPPPSCASPPSEEKPALISPSTLRPPPLTESFWRTWEPPTSFTLNSEVCLCSQVLSASLKMFRYWWSSWRCDKLSAVPGWGRAEPEFHMNLKRTQAPESTVRTCCNWRNYCYTLCQMNCLFGFNILKNSWNLADWSVVVKIYIFHWFQKWAGPNGSTAPPRNFTKFMKNQWFDLGGWNLVGT